MANQSGLRGLAEKLNDLDRKVRANSSPQLAHSSIEDGAVQAYDRDGNQTMQIGKQWDGTYVPASMNGPIPPVPSAPIVTGATESLIVAWDGSFAGGLVPTPMDFLRVDAHVGATPDFIPDHGNRRLSFVAPQGGEMSIGLPPGTYYVKLVCWSIAGKVSEASTPASGDSVAAATSSAGGPRASSPAAEVVVRVLGAAASQRTLAHPACTAGLGKRTR